MHEGGRGTRTRHIPYPAQRGPERAGKNPKGCPNSRRNPFLVKILYQELCPRTHPAHAALGCMGLPWEESPANRPCLCGFRIGGFRIYCRLTGETRSCRAASVHQNLDRSSAPTGRAPKYWHHQRNLAWRWEGDGSSPCLPAPSGTRSRLLCAALPSGTSQSAAPTPAAFTCRGCFGSEMTDELFSPPIFKTNSKKEDKYLTVSPIQLHYCFFKQFPAFHQQTEINRLNLS